MRRLSPFLASLLVAHVLLGCEGEPTPFGPPGDAGVRLDGEPEPDQGRSDRGRDTAPRKDGQVPGPDAKPKTDGGLPAGDAKADGPKPDAALPYPARYPTGLVHSPITAYVAQNLKNIAKKGPNQKNSVFSKIGNSITVSTNFLHCFAGSKVTLGPYSSLGSTLSYFKTDLGGGITPYNRQSLCATVGWSAWSALSGSPSPLTKELTAISPRFAVLKYGTNDIEAKNIYSYADNMLDIVDTMLSAGVIPLLTSIPPRDDKPSSNTEVPRYNAVVRGIAQARQIPFQDYHQELLKLSDHGLGPDKLHPSANYTLGACDFTSAGLAYGYNLRNLLTLQSLDRAKAVVVDNKAFLDPPGPMLAGNGTPTSPFVVDGLPFTDLRNTKTGGTKTLASYPGCSATQDESGPEFIYRLTVTQTTTIRALVFDRGTVDIDLHLLGAQVSGQSCIKRDHEVLTAQLAPGTYHFSLDTYVKSSTPQAGEYLFVLLKE